MSEAPTPSSSSPVSLPATTTTGGAVGAGGSSAGLLAGGPSIAAAVVTGSVVAANTPSSHQGHQQHRFSRLGMAPKAHQSRTDDPAKIFKLIDDNVIGKSAVFLGPYGRRKGEQLHIMYHYYWLLMSPRACWLMRYVMRRYLYGGDS